MSGLNLMIIAATFAIGILAGTTGMGGLLIPPLLAYFIFHDFTEAVATSMIIYIFMGVGGVYVFMRHGSILWKDAGLLSVGAVPGALIGAGLHGYVPVRLLEALLALLLMGAGFRAVRANDSATRVHGHSISSLLFIAIGLGIGVVSALTGVGGPVLMVPLLVALKMEVHLVIGVSIASSLPLATAASIGYLIEGSAHGATAVGLGAVAMLGTVVGARKAHRIDQSRLSQLVGAFLLVVGVVLTGIAIYRLLVGQF